MDRTKLKNLVKKYEEHLIVDRGLGQSKLACSTQSASRKPAESA